MAQSRRHLLGEGGGGHHKGKRKDHGKNHERKKV
ncbi:hypothetical protein CCACVL1_13382 [Corchorus capsularis]|uniref:Uncharacterized protein n=1 Tax=Corchorus capsularis TaxID=210143 RepID=A0A1R3IBG7_COCAP|nr:hypothetical protein CCACVL1_13382 [Corchorus capsularis]